ncbi:MFS transporter, partial [Streptomyces sp. 12257]|nr:MFS transporter [Streptomyces sp. 12257]
FLRDLLPALLLFGPGVGACAVAGSIAALTGVGERDSGVASGIQTAAFQIGGAFGVAVVTSASVSHTVGTERLAALTAGHQAAFTACVALAVAGIACASVLLRTPRSSTAEPLPKAAVTRGRVRS